MTEEFTKRLNDATARQRTKNDEKDRVDQTAAAEKAEQQRRQDVASHALLAGPVKNLFSSVAKEANDALAGTGKYITVSVEDNYFLKIKAHKSSSRSTLPNVSLFVDMDGNIVTTYSEHPQLRKFPTPDVMRPEKYLSDTVQKVVGDLVEAATT